MSYSTPPSYPQGSGYNYGYGAPWQLQPYFTAPTGPAPGGFDPVALQMRIVKAKQVNLMCKQALVRNYLMQNNRGLENSSQRSLGTRDAPAENVLPVPAVSNVDKSASFQTAANSVQGLSKIVQRMQPKPAVEKFDNVQHRMSTDSLLAPSETGSEEAIELARRDSPRNAPDRDDIAENEDDDAVPFDAESPGPRRVTDREEVQLLNGLAETLTQTVTDSGAVLKKLNAKKNRLPAAEKAKRKMENMIKVNANAPVVMPLWRHKLNGRPNPAPETVLKGIRLFRLIAKSLLYMFIKPTVAVIKHKLSTREGERRDLQKTLKLVAGSFDDWLGKIVQLPVTSVAQDASLNFEPTESIALNAQPLKTRMLQLKVRLRGVVMNLAKADMPNDFITDSLIALIEDRNYFPAGLLWDTEVEQLEFNSLGATRNMVIDVDAPATTTPVGSRLSSRQPALPADKNLVSLTVEDEVTIGGAPSVPVRLNAARTRMMLQNFLLVRTVVSHVLLSPWRCNLTAAPPQRSAKRVVYNHRVLATSMYELLRTMDSTLPAIPEDAAKAGAPPRITEKFIVRARPPGAGYVLGDAMIDAARKVQVLTPAPSLALLPGLPSGASSKTGGAGAGAGLSSLGIALPGAKVTPRTGTATGGVRATPRPATATGEKSAGAAVTANAGAALPAVPEDAVVEGVDDLTPTEGPKAKAGGFLGTFTRLIGLAETSVGLDALSQGGVESRLLEERAEFCSLGELHSLLMAPSQLAPLRAHWDAWFPELRGPLEAWLQRLVVHVLARRHKQKREKEAKELAAAAAAAGAS